MLVVKRIASIALGAFLTSAGISHLGSNRTEFLAQVPTWLPLNADFVVVASGLVEITLGICLIITTFIFNHLRHKVGLIVAIFFNSVIVSQFMKTDDTEMPLKRIIILSSVVSGIGLIIFLIGGAYRGIGSVMIFTAIMLWAYRFGLRKLANRFQNRTIPKWERFYEKTLRRALSGAMPYVLTVGIIILLFIALTNKMY
mgnify:CR=1 FL=1